MAGPSKLGVSRFRNIRVHDRFGTLLALLLASFLLNGFIADRWARIAIGGIQIALLVVVYYSTRVDGVLRRKIVLPFMILTAVTFGSLLIFEGNGSRTALGASSLLSVMIFGVILYLVVRRVISEREVNLETLLGAMCIYFLLGLLFSAVFHAADVLGAGSVFGEPIARSEYSYFSFVTLTTLGYGDIAPVGDLVRRLAVIEAMCGQIFLATVIARMVSLYGVRDLAEQLEEAESQPAKNQESEKGQA